MNAITCRGRNYCHCGCSLCTTEKEDPRDDRIASLTAEMEQLRKDASYAASWREKWEREKADNDHRLLVIGGMTTEVERLRLVIDSDAITASDMAHEIIQTRAQLSDLRQKAGRLVEATYLDWSDIADPREELKAALAGTETNCPHDKVNRVDLYSSHGGSSEWCKQCGAVRSSEIDGEEQLLIDHKWPWCFPTYLSTASTPTTNEDTILFPEPPRTTHAAIVNVVRVAEQLIVIDEEPDWRGLLERLVYRCYLKMSPEESFEYRDAKAALEETKQ